MESSRRKNAAGNVKITTVEEAKEVKKTIDKEEERRQRKEEKRQELMGTTSYYLMDKIQTIFDKYYIDPILCFFVPGMGDITTGVLGLPYLYFAMAHVKSVPLTLAVIYNILIDCLIGLIPWLGDIFDIFHKAYTKNMKLIVGFVNDDQQVIGEVRRKATMTAVLICVLCFLIYLMVKLIIALAEKVGSLFDWII